MNPRPQGKPRVGIMATVFVLTAIGSGAISALDAPTLPVGVFYTSSRTDEAYVRKVAEALKKDRFNTVVANRVFTRAMIDVFQQQGIAVVTCGDQNLDHPAVIASLAGQGQEPSGEGDREALRTQVQELGKKTDKPVILCSPGEGMGLFGPDDPRMLWKDLTPKIRCFRWYGISQGYYGTLHKRSDRGWLSLTSVLSIAQRGETPFWIALPSFGKQDPASAYQPPTPAQIKAMTHLALAYRAHGILYYSLQSHDGWQGLVEDETLQPCDGAYAAATEMAALISKHADLLASFQHQGLDLRCPNPVVDAVPLRAGKEPKIYTYVINKDTEKPATARLLLWAQTWTWTRAEDVFTGKVLEVKEADEEGYLNASLALAPGEGQLLLLDAAGKKAANEK